MRYIKEPEGVDFIIKSKSLTDKDREEISKFIQEYKEKHKKKKTSTNRKKKNAAPILHKPGANMVSFCSL